MKFLVTILLLLSFRFVLKAQNLVPNPSFEDTVYCPFGTNQIDAAVNWMSFGNSPDYYNACAPAYLNVPDSEFGFQYAHTGVAMAGVVTYLNPEGPDGPNYRELIGTQLLTPLEPNMKYFLSFYVNYSYFNQYQAVASNKLGLRFSTSSFTSFNQAQINNIAHLYTDSIISDSVQWIKISGVFVADSLFNYLTIGNFFDDDQTDTIVLSQYPSVSYYYIDDVCVTADSLYNDEWTGYAFSNIQEHHVICFPNPTSDFVIIRSDEQIEEIELINNIGQSIQLYQVHRNTVFKLSTLDIRTGMYLIKIKTKDALFTTVINVIDNPKP